jgi:hypothetical protein
VDVDARGFRFREDRKNEMNDKPQCKTSGISVFWICALFVYTLTAVAILISNTFHLPPFRSVALLCLFAAFPVLASWLVNHNPWFRRVGLSMVITALAMWTINLPL